MTTHADNVHAPADSSPPPQTHRSALKLVLAAGMAIGIWGLMWMSMGTHQNKHWSQNIIFPTGILAIACLVGLRHEHHWAGPMRRFHDLLPRIRNGEAAIEELASVKGGLLSVVPEVQELLRELRQQQAAVAELNDEIRQRVASRTDALERKIGSLRQQAVRDGLTGLYNRRMLDQFLPQLLEKCRTEAIDLCLMMIDVDHFKMLNDTLGHAAGDELLRDIGKLIRSSVRDQDAAFRYGGDEFVVLLPGASAEAARVMGERLESLVDGMARALRVEKRPRLSIGFAQASALEKPAAAELLAAADRMLYQTKSTRKTGRPRAVPACT